MEEDGTIWLLDRNQLDGSAVTCRPKSWPVFVSFALLLAAASGAASPSPHSLIQAHEQFVVAYSEGDWEGVKRTMYLLALEPKNAASYEDQFLRVARGSRASGLVLRDETIRSIEFYREGDRQLAFLRVTQKVETPFDPSTPIVKNTTRFAVSEDGGRTWKINVLDCFVTSQLKKLFPKYTGVPATFEP